MENSNNSSSKTSITLLTSTQSNAISYASEIEGFKFMSTLKAPHFRQDKRSPLDLICVVDRSGSMEGEKLSLVKDTLLFVVSQLTEVDRLGVVSYDSSIEVTFPLLKMNEEGKQQARIGISSIYHRGSTNLCGGLIKGIDLMRERETKNEVASVLLFTDGLANSGYQKLNDIVRAMTDPEFAKKGDNYSFDPFPPFPPNAMPVQNFQQQYLNASPQLPAQQLPFAPYQQLQTQTQTQSPFPGPSFAIRAPKGEEPVSEKVLEGSRIHIPLGCTVNTFGFGSDHDPNLLKGIADAGSGIYYFIQGASNISESFADCLGGLLSVAAQNISMKLESVNNVKIQRIITKFKTTTIKEGESYELSVGDIQSDERRDILVSVKLPTLPQEVAAFEICKISLSYYNVIDSRTESNSVTTFISRPSIVPPQTTNFELDKQYNRFSAAEAMEKATDFGNNGNLAAGRKILENVVAQIRESVSGKDPFCQGLIIDLGKCAETLKSDTSYQQLGQQMLNNNYNAHYMQRSSNVQMASQAAYQTPSRMMQQEIQQKSVNSPKKSFP